MPRVTKAMLEEENTQLKFNNRRFLETIALQSDKIKVLQDLIKLSPTGGLFMAMMSTNKLARKMIDRVYPKEGCR